MLWIRPQEHFGLSLQEHRGSQTEEGPGRPWHQSSKAHLNTGFLKAFVTWVTLVSFLWPEPAVHSPQREQGVELPAVSVKSTK